MVDKKKHRGVDGGRCRTYPYEWGINFEHISVKLNPYIVKNWLDVVSASWERFV